MSNPKKLPIQSGQRFGNLEVIEEAGRFPQPSGQWQRAFLCKCDCGETKKIRISHLTTGRVTSCGCKARTIGGRSRSPIYNTWRGMVNRCHYPSYREFHLYGGRGITVCNEWRHDIAAFERWAYANGFRPGLQIDRTDNDQGYGPENCRFVTPKENHRNRRVTLRVKYRGETLPLISLLERLGKASDYRTIADRIYHGWDHEAAINRPIIPSSRKGPKTEREAEGSNPSKNSNSSPPQNKVTP